MAYDRAKRFPKLITQTPPKIGPGTYDILESPQPKRHLADDYPFLCGAKRRTVTVSKNAELVPAPGSYNIKDPQRHIPGGVSIDFTDARFKEHVSEGPGPVFNVAIDLLKSRKIRSHSGTWRGPAGKLWLTKPPPSIVPNPTSVPGKLFSGYHTNEYGTLVKNPPTKHEPTDFYEIPRDEANTTTLIYKGNFWSRMTGRKEPRIMLTPGPGDYELEAKPNPIQIQNEKVKEEKRMTSRQPRFLDTIYKKEMRQNFPAPNSYKVKGAFDRFMSTACKCDPYALDPPPFGTTAKRFNDKPQSDIPGPGTYDPPIRIKCVGSIYLAPFGTCAGRFKKDPEDPGPGPSDYNLIVGNLAHESQKRFKYFYVSQSRPQVSFDSMFLFDDEDYEDTDIAEKPEEKKSNVYHAAFKCRKERFPKPDKMDVPGPGAYEVLTAFKANRNKCEFLYPTFAPPFGSRSSRIPKELFGPSTDTPDPTRYKLAGDMSKNVKGGVISAARKIREQSVAPPPTRYCIHPYVTSSFTKKSFNSVLGKPEIIKRLEERKKPFGPRCPCKRKKLRWFAIPLHENKRC